MSLGYVPLMRIDIGGDDAGDSLQDTVERFQTARRTRKAFVIEPAFLDKPPLYNITSGPSSFMIGSFVSRPSYDPLDCALRPDEPSLLAEHGPDGRILQTDEERWRWTGWASISDIMIELADHNEKDDEMHSVRIMVERRMGHPPAPVYFNSDEIHPIADNYEGMYHVRSGKVLVRITDGPGTRPSFVRKQKRSWSGQ